MKPLPPGTRYTPVPNPFLGPLLEEVDHLGELKCTLRFLWLLHQKRTYPRFVTFKELLGDRTLALALQQEVKGQGAGEALAQALKDSLDRAVQRGTLLHLPLRRSGARGPEDEETESLYFLNTEADRKVVERIQRGELSLGRWAFETPSPSFDPAEERPDIFTLYEENIGILTPLVAEELKEAEKSYPGEWIRDAFREAVIRNKRSWRYIARILERWATHGREEYGEAGRHPQKVDPKEYLRRYGKYRPRDLP